MQWELTYNLDVILLMQEICDQDRTLKHKCDVNGGMEYTGMHYSHESPFPHEDPHSVTTPMLHLVSADEGHLAASDDGKGVPQPSERHMGIEWAQRTTRMCHERLIKRLDGVSDNFSSSLQLHIPADMDRQVSDSYADQPMILLEASPFSPQV